MLSFCCDNSLIDANSYGGEWTTVDVSFTFVFWRSCAPQQEDILGPENFSEPQDGFRKCVGT